MKDFSKHIFSGKESKQCTNRPLNLNELNLYIDDIINSSNNKKDEESTKDYDDKSSTTFSKENSHLITHQLSKQMNEESVINTYYSKEVPKHVKYTDYINDFSKELVTLNNPRIEIDFNSKESTSNKYELYQMKKIQVNNSSSAQDNYCLNPNSFNDNFINQTNLLTLSNLNYNSAYSSDNPMYKNENIFNNNKFENLNYFTAENCRDYLKNLNLNSINNDKMNYIFLNYEKLGDQKNTADLLASKNNNMLQDNNTFPISNKINTNVCNYSSKIPTYDHKYVDSPNINVINNNSNYFKNASNYSGYVNHNDFINYNNRNNFNNYISNNDLVFNHNKNNNSCILYNYNQIYLQNNYCTCNYNLYNQTNKIILSNEAHEYTKNTVNSIQKRTNCLKKSKITK